MIKIRTFKDKPEKNISNNSNNDNGRGQKLWIDYDEWRRGWWDCKT